MKVKDQSRFGAALIAGVFFAGPLAAQCLVQDAAQAALQRELQLIEAMAVDPAASFRGPDSCVNMDVLTSLDLSNLIPDLSGLLADFSMDAINGAISGAQSQVCRQIQDAIGSSVGDATSAVTQFNSGLTGELNSVLSNGWTDLGLEL